jgi:hypothetical protein
MPRFKWVRTALFLIAACRNPGIAQPATDGLSVLSAERFETAYRGTQELLHGKEHVVLVLKVKGITRADLNSDLLRDGLYVKVKAEEFRYKPVSVDITFTNSDGSWKNERDLVFVIPRTVTDLVLYVGKRESQPFSVSRTIKAERRL